MTPHSTGLDVQEEKLGWRRQTTFRHRLEWAVSLSKKAQEWQSLTSGIRYSMRDVPAVNCALQGEKGKESWNFFWCQNFGKWDAMYIIGILYKGWSGPPLPFWISPWGFIVATTVGLVPKHVHLVIQPRGGGTCDNLGGPK